MIYFNISLTHPNWWNRFKNIKFWSGKTPWKEKHWEIQITKSEHIFRVEFQWTIRQDHAGARLELGLFGYQIDFGFYDSRHWNTEKGRWINYSDPKDTEGDRMGEK